MSYCSTFEGKQSKAFVPFLASPLLQQKHFNSVCFFFPLVCSSLFTEKAGKLNYFGMPYFRMEKALLGMEYRVVVGWMSAVPGL